MTLYRTYRPQSFSDVVGQDHIVTTIEQAVKQDKLAHAYLFCGTRGTGKTSVARILAKTMLMKGIEDEERRVQINAGVEDGSLVDLIEIDAASNRRIDDIRELIEKIQFSPVTAAAKVYIVDEVHMLTKEAFNALLKTLEEPPDYAYFILATTELHKVPETIQSRCQRFVFRRVREEDLISRLQYIADQEHITIDREALRAIAHHATGSFRDAISLLDQLRSLESITLADVEERLGKTSAGLVEEILQVVAARNTAEIPGIIRTIEQAGMPLDQILGEMLSVVRTRMHEAIAAKQDIGAHMALIGTLLAGLKDMRLSPLPILTLESTLLSLCGITAAQQTPAMPAPTPKTQSPAAPAPPKAVAHEPVKAAPTIATEQPQSKPGIIHAEELTAENVKLHWNDIVKKVPLPHVRMSLKNGTINAVTGHKITLAFGSTFHREKVAETAASRSVEDILQDIFKRPVQIECVLESQKESAAAEPSTDLIEAAAEVFGGM